MNTDFESLFAQFIQPSVKAMALMGSFARGDAGPYSDVDLVRFLAGEQVDPPGKGSHLFNGRLVVVSNISPSQVENWFTRPEEAVEVIAGLRAARPLHDPEQYFASIQQRAHAFVWDGPMQQKANAYASQEMVGWIEEVHKGMEGLRRQDVGRMLNAKHGLTWGMARVLTVHRGLLKTGDNAFYDQILDSMGRESEWARQWQITFGVGNPTSLAVQIVAGLHVYRLTAEMLDVHLRPEDAPLIRETANRIQQFLDKIEPP